MFAWICPPKCPLNKYVGMISCVCRISLELETSCVRVTLKNWFLGLFLLGWTTVIYHHHHLVFMPNAAAGVLTGTAGLTCPQAAAWDPSGQGNTDLQHGPPAVPSGTRRSSFIRTNGFYGLI